MGELAEHFLNEIHRLSREKFQARHGFEGWDSVWETLWTVETGYSNA
jgi:hypothetical protein